ncbi:MAG TPA: NADH-quinone oxidoreductase subunit C [Haliangium sp.]|nr:NADH-quinone oxidoreductase subunit C [Haliangium sp.]
MAQTVLDALTKKFGDAIEETRTDYGDAVAYVKRDKLVEVATWLRDDPAMDFDAPSFCTCIDNLHMDGGEEPRFELCYQLRSSRHRHLVRLKIRLREEDAIAPSLTLLWPGFNWLERETYDMYGIQFKGHPDLRRIYMYEEFVGYPLRKDYPKEKRQPLVRRDDLPST